jgi:hypothetical protein
VSGPVQQALRVLNGFLRELKGDTLKTHGLKTSQIASRVVVWWVDSISHERREIARVKPGAEEMEVLAALYDRMRAARTAPARQPAKVVSISRRAAGGGAA